jgi:hypothetical protein
MALVLIATPGASNANSFATLAQFQTYMESRLYGDAWEDYDDDVVLKALITATRLIAEYFNRVGWQGFVVSSTQALPMPRSGMLYPNGWPIPSSIIPQQLVDATSELAFRLIEAGAMPDDPSETAGLKSLLAGPVKLEFTEDSGTVTVELPERIMNMIAFLGVNSSRHTVPLQRG